MLATLVRKNLVQRPLRYLLTALAILFGVAAVTAVFIFTDGLRDTFDELAGNIESGYDVSIQSDSPFGDGLSNATVPLEVLDQVQALDSVAAAQPRIAEFGVVAIDADGEPALTAGGAPNIGLNWESRTPNLRLFVLDGSEPVGPDQFVMDILAFESRNFTIGDRYQVLTPGGSQEFELAGTFSYADPESSATVGAIILAFDEATALELLNGGEGYDDLTLVANGSAEDLISDLKPILSARDDVNLVARNQAEVEAEVAGNFGQIASIFRTILLVFAGIILFVSAYLIFNVFNITLGQRIKELGLLRSIGAFGSQVTTMMLGEALLLGIFATVIGLPAGWGLARLLRFGLIQLGFPGDTGLPVNPLTIALAVAVGIGVTMLAALFPSIQARRVTPIVALRDGASIDDLAGDRQPAAGAASLVVGLVVFFVGMFAFDGWLGALVLTTIGGVLVFLGLNWIFGGASAIPRLGLLGTGLLALTVVRFAEFGLGKTFGLLGAGALLTLLGAGLVSGIFAGPIAKAIGYPWLAAAALVLGAIYAVSQGPAGVVVAVILVLFAISTAFASRGLTGRLGRDNASRNPQRTATTATAMMIGLALVTTVTVIGDSIKSSVTDALGSSITADWLIRGPQSGPQGLPFSTQALDIVDAENATSLTVPFQFNFAGFARIEGTDAATVQANVPSLFASLGNDDLDPADFDQVKADLGATEISVDDVLGTDFATVRNHIDADFVDLDTSVPVDQAIWIEDSFAEDRGFEMGDTFVAVFLDGQAEELTVAGIYEDGFVFGSRVIDFSLWDKHLPSDQISFMSVSTADGVAPEAARADLEAALAADYPILTVEDRTEFAADAEAQINQTLAVVNLLLLLSAAIAILGIAIALALAVFERTREIGLLRAVGTTARQMRQMIRWEGLIIAAFGGVVGIVLGIGLGVLATQKMPEFLVTTTSLPVGTILFYLVIAAFTGMLAGAFPAWLAGRMNVLEAISNE